MQSTRCGGYIHDCYGSVAKFSHARIRQRLQADRGQARKAQQHGLTPRRAERSQRRRAHDLAREPVGNHQAFASGQQRCRKVAVDREIEATPPVPRCIAQCRLPASAVVSWAPDNCLRRRGDGRDSARLYARDDAFRRQYVHAQTVERLDHHDIEPALIGIGLHLLERRPKAARAAQRLVGIDLPDRPALPLDLAATDLQLVLDRRLALIVRRVPGIDHGAHSVSSG